MSTVVKRGSGRFHMLRVLAVLTLTGCGAEGDPQLTAEEPVGTTRVSFEEFERSTYREPGTGHYIVDGDMPLRDVQELREYYESRPKSGGLILHTSGGVDAKWTSPQQLNLTYCVSTSFGGSYATVVEAMQRAANAWESAANVNFIHVPSQDSACTASNANVVFDVNPVSGQPYQARAFLPTFPRSTRNVLIDGSVFWLPEPITLTGILRHELGHTLGFRHEHTRPESGCYEDSNWRPITAYDSASVMHYPTCPGSSGTGEYFLTQRDRIGVRSLYGRGNGNLALMGNTHASSTYCGSGASNCYSSNRVNDGSRDTTLTGTQSWTNDQGTPLPQFVEIDLGGYHIVDSATVFSSSGGVMQDYSLEFWNGWGWVPSVLISGNTQVQRSYSFTPVLANTARLVGRRGSATQPGYIRVNEIELYNSHENLALTASASASSTYCGSSPESCYSAAHVNDGNPNTALSGYTSWTNDGLASLPQWVELNLGGPRTFGRVTLYLTTGYAAQAYSLQYWNGSAWVTVLSVTGNTQVQRSHTFTPVTASRLRVLGQLGSTNQPQYVRINEIEVYEN